MRILFLLPQFRPTVGGLEILCHQLATELRSRGHDVAVITSAGDAGAPAGLDEFEGIRVLRTEAFLASVARDPGGMLRARRRTEAFAQDFAADLMHDHNLSPSLWLLGQRVLLGCPLVVTLHNVMSRHLPHRPRSMSRLVDAADWVTGVSEDVVDDTLSYAPGVKDRISVIRNAVSPPGPAGGPIPDGPAELLSVGRLVEQKGFDRAIDAMASVVTRCPDVHLSIVGTGPARADLQERIDRLGLGAHVTLVGRVEHDRIAGLMAASTALVMPSRFEGLPLVALEAAWMSRPVVGTRVAGLRQAVADRVTGLLVDEDDIGALASAIVELVSDRNLARTLGAAARAGVAEGWSLEAAVDRYEVLYERLVAERVP